MAVVKFNPDTIKNRQSNDNNDDRIDILSRKVKSMDAASIIPTKMAWRSSVVTLKPTESMHPSDRRVLRTRTAA